jgi:hypothetical protein
MPRLSRKLRVCKWIGTLGCVLIVLGFVVSGWFWFIWTDSVKHDDMGGYYDERSLSLAQGSIRYIRAAHGNSHPGWKLARDKSWHVLPNGALPISKRSTARPVAAFVDVPLWLPLLIVFTPTLLLWHRDRKLRPGHCRKCDYDLTGNTSGRCPECGEPIPAAAKE